MDESTKYVSCSLLYVILKILWHLERHYHLPGGELNLYTETDNRETMDKESPSYAAILQSTIFPFKANVTMIMFSHDGDSGKFSLDVSFFS